MKIYRCIFRVVACAVFASALLGCEPARVDAQMEELCKKDGGMKIYETVPLRNDQFKYGVPNFHNTWNTTSGGYRFVALSERLKMNKPTLTRYEYSVIREADNKTLGIYVVYSRVGGGIIWRPGPDPSKICPTEGNDNTFLNAVFVQADQEK